MFAFGQEFFQRSPLDELLLHRGVVGTEKKLLRLAGWQRFPLDLAGSAGEVAQHGTGAFAGMAAVKHHELVNRLCFRSFFGNLPDQVADFLVCKHSLPGVGERFVGKIVHHKAADMAVEFFPGKAGHRGFFPGTVTGEIKQHGITRLGLAQVGLDGCHHIVFGGHQAGILLPERFGHYPDADFVKGSLGFRLFQVALEQLHVAVAVLQPAHSRQKGILVDPDQEGVEVHGKRAL